MEVPVTNGHVKRWLALVAVVAAVVANTPAIAVAASNSGRIDPTLLALAKADPRGTFEVVVRAAGSDKRDHRALRASQAIDAARGRVGHLLSIIGGASATLTGAQLIALSHDSYVGYVTPDQVLSAKFDPTLGASAASSPGILEVDAPRAWRDLGVTGRGVGVAIVDSGIAAHRDLTGRILASVDFTTGAPGDPLVAPADPGGHGTHVAGLVAGDGASSGGAYTGVAPEANLVDVRVIGASGSTNVSTVLRGLQWVLGHRDAYNIRVVNMSLGSPSAISYRLDPLATAVEVLTFANITVVVSAGNSGPGDATVTAPGDDPFAITVGAIDDNGTATPMDDSLAPWSSRGPTLGDGIMKPDLVAPGRRMVSLRSAGSTIDTSFPDRRVAGTDALDPQYFRMSGTSMAAPVVTGIVALMLQRDPTLTSADVRRHLVGTATPLPYGSLTTTGAGLANAYAAVSAVGLGGPSNAYRVSDGFAWDMLPYLKGQALVFRDPAFNGGVDSHGTPWSSVTWANVVWDDITWQDVAWESFNWNSITWQDIAWEDIAWETTTTPPSDGTGWRLLD